MLIHAIVDYHSFGWICHSLYIHSPVDKHLSCFQFELLTMKNKGAMNNHGYLHEHKFHFFSVTI